MARTFWSLARICDAESDAGGNSTMPELSVGDGSNAVHPVEPSQPTGKGWRSGPRLLAVGLGVCVAVLALNLEGDWGQLAPFSLTIGLAMILAAAGVSFRERRYALGTAALASAGVVLMLSWMPWYGPHSTPRSVRQTHRHPIWSLGHQH